MATVFHTRTLHAREETRFGEADRSSQPIMQRVGGFVELPALLGQLDVPPGPLFESEGLSLDDFSQPENRVPFDVLMRLLVRCRDATGMEDFNLLLGRRWHLGHFGWLGRKMRAAPTVGHALRLLAAYQHYNSDAGAAFLLVYQGVASLGYIVYRVPREDVSPAYELTMMVGLGIMRELCGASWSASEVLFARSAPSSPSRFHQAFGCPVRFDNDHCALHFPARWLEAVPVTAATEGRPADPSDAPGPGDPFQWLHRTVRLLLVEGKSTGDDLARILALNRRTLNRRLRARGTTFRQVLDEVRYDTARQLLAQTNVPIEEIAAALCYSEVSAFTHAFRRWSATTPGQYRVSARKPAKG